MKFIFNNLGYIIGFLLGPVTIYLFDKTFKSTTHNKGNPKHNCKTKNSKSV